MASSAVAMGVQGRACPPDGCLCPLILGYSKFFVLFGAPRNDKTTNNSINKLKFPIQNTFDAK